MTSTIGPLTTVFEPPASCLSQASMLAHVNNIWGQQGPLSTGDCFPSFYQSARSAYYSPGVCPSGYTAACSSQAVIGTVTQVVQTCCPAHGPSGWSITYACNTAPVSYFWESTMVCVSDLPNTNWTMEVVATTLGDTTSSIITRKGVSGAINAFGVQIMLQSTDFQSTTTSTSGTTSETGKGTAVPAQTGTAAADTAASSSDISTAAALGIGIVCGAAIFGIIAAAILLFLRRRRRRQTNSAEPTAAWPSRPEYDDMGQALCQLYPAELSPKARLPELQQADHSWELAATRSRG